MLLTRILAVMALLPAIVAVQCMPSGPIPEVDESVAPEFENTPDDPEPEPRKCTTRLTRTVNGNGIIVAEPDLDTYACGDTVSVQAVPGVGWGFVRWEGDLRGAVAQQQLSMTHSRKIVAVFEPDAPPKTDPPPTEPTAGEDQAAGPPGQDDDPPRESPPPSSAEEPPSEGPEPPAGGPQPPPDFPDPPPEDPPPPPDEPSAPEPPPPAPVPPVIGGLEDDIAVTGLVYRRQLGVVEGAAPITWSLVSGPHGMEIDPETGEIQWPEPRPPDSAHSVTIMANNPDGSDEASYQLDVVSMGLLDCNLSSTSARDGQTLTAGYQIAGPPGMRVRLGCRLIAPDETVGFDDGAPTVTLSSQSGWCYRDLFVNAAPKADTGTYDVEWQVHWHGEQLALSRKAEYLTLTEPLAVRVLLLMYHYVGPVAHSPYWVRTARFAAQMRALRAYGYETISFADLMEYRAGEKVPPAKPVILTFDDGDVGLHSHVLPILSDPDIDFTATAFVITGLMGEFDPPHILLSWEQAQALHESGRFDIQSHTVTHPYMSSLDGLEQMYELIDSRRDIEFRLKKPVHFLCWPYGDLNSSAKRAAWKAGYRAAIGIGPGIEVDCSDKWAFRRVFPDWNTTLEYAPHRADSFFFNQIGDSDVVIPELTVEEVCVVDPQALEPWYGAVVPQGGRVRLRVSAVNNGPSAEVKAVLKLEPTATEFEAQRLFVPGSEQFEWEWSIPEDAPPGRYYARCTFHDSHGVITWCHSHWQMLLTVTAP